MSSTSQPAVPGEFFDYFSAIEERFNARRGSLLLLSTLDWALIETWREAGVPLQAVLRGIDQSFDKYEVRSRRAAAGKSRLRKVNGLAWCAQAVMEAAEQIVEASTGLPANARRAPADSGFEPASVAAFLERNAASLESPGQLPDTGAATSIPDAQGAVRQTLTSTAARLREMATAVQGSDPPPLEDLDRTLTLLEERLLATLRTSASEDDLAALNQAAEQEIGSSRARLGAAQSRRVRELLVGKWLLQKYRLPRLSLFYMGLSE